MLPHCDLVSIMVSTSSYTILVVKTTFRHLLERSDWTQLLKDIQLSYYMMWKNQTGVELESSFTLLVSQFKRHHGICQRITGTSEGSKAGSMTGASQKSFTAECGPLEKVGALESGFLCTFELMYTLLDCPRPLTGITARKSSLKPWIIFQLLSCFWKC